MLCSSPDTALVLFSGGQDSTICLAWALNRFSRVYTLGFDYGQQHTVEMQCRASILSEIGTLRADWQQKLGSDTVLDLSIMQQLAYSSLVPGSVPAEGTACKKSDSVPDSFVPGRNLIFLTLSAALAYKLGVRHIISGVCETDFSGYPDCRDDTIKALQVALNLGMECRLVLHTPLMWLSKAQSWLLAYEQMQDTKACHTANGHTFVEFVRTQTHTCYLGERKELHPWGYGCGQCPACALRKKGWEEFVASNTEAAR